MEVVFIILADCIDPHDPAGRTYRQVNAARDHAIPVGTLVEVIDDENEAGVRLYVVKHSRDCDQTPLYCLSARRDDTVQDDKRFYNSKWLTGYSEESIRVPK